MIARVRRVLSSIAFDAASLLGRVRRRRVGAGDVARLSYREQTRRMGLRMDERLRDLLRGNWLRLRRADAADDARDTQSQ